MVSVSKNPQGPNGQTKTGKPGIRIHASKGKGEPPFQMLFEMFGVELKVSGDNGHAQECPFCGRDRFYVNVKEGTYKCHSENNCGAKGNAYTWIRHWYDEFLRLTTDDHYRRLSKERGLPLQTLKRHGLAWSEMLRCWFIPFKSAKGEVLNLQQYRGKGQRKYTLPGLNTQLYGLNELSPQAERGGRTLLVVEGPWDAIALDHHLREKKSRDRYDVLAVPSANIFKPEWLVHLIDYKEVRLCFDNDEAGRGGQERIAKMVREAKADGKLGTIKLAALKWPADSGLPEGYDISNLIADGLNVVQFTHQYCLRVTTGAGLGRINFVRGDAIAEERIEWFWEGHIPFATFVSLSGLMGTHKSLIARYLSAKATSGKRLPRCKKAVDPFNVLYFTSEDAASRVRELVRIHGGDLTRLFVHDIISGSEPIDILECLKEMEVEINTRQARLVVLDALNSFVGGDISSDSKARRTLSGRLQVLARKTGACIIGIRNWGRMAVGTASQKALCATSLSDVARCVMNTRELPDDEEGDKPDYPFLLEFEKVSDAPKPLPLPYRIWDKSTGPADKYLRIINWDVPVPPVTPQDVEKFIKRRRSAFNAARCGEVYQATPSKRPAAL